MTLTTSKEARETASATEESGSVPLPIAQDSRGKKGQRSFLATAARDLSEDEVDTPAGRRFLIADIDRLQEECDQLKTVERKYHDLRVANAHLDAQVKSNDRLDWLTLIATSAGAAGLSTAPSYMADAELSNFGYALLAISIVLVAAGILVRRSK